MEDVGNEESKKAQEEMGEEIDGLGVSLFHDASPSVKKLVCRESAALQSPELLKDGTDVPGTSSFVVELDTGSLYNTYILPKVPISEEAMNTTGIVVNSDLEKMTVHDTLLPVVSGFIDSLSVFKKAFPGQQNYKQETLVKAVLNTSYASHDATEDVKTFRPGPGFLYKACS
uniref:Uncharacterized protein n=1 Tax=Magallana gigas TaxID=29159 RepID=A0A8W8P3B2_MAGGI